MNHILSKTFYGQIFFKGNKKITSEIFANFPKCGATVLGFHRSPSEFLLITTLPAFGLSKF